MPDNTWSSLRRVMYQPSATWLATEYSGDRWLTDQFVMLLVSDWEELRDIPDGPYKLTVSGGPQPRDAVPEPDIEEWFRAVAGRDWRAAEPTEWSVAEHPGKAQLWAVERHGPVLMGESTWTALRRHYPDAKAECSVRADGEGVKRSLFRFLAAERRAFAYAAGIRIPDGQEPAARAVVAALETPGSRDAAA